MPSRRAITVHESDKICHEHLEDAWLIAAGAKLSFFASFLEFMGMTLSRARNQIEIYSNSKNFEFLKSFATFIKTS